MSKRLIWIDIAKGIGIVLVVVGHAGRGIMNAGIPDPIGFLPELDRVIYAFHMPLFFILSGITFGLKPIAKLNPDLRLRLWRIFYPLILWTYIFLGVRALAGGHANTTTSWEDLLVLPLPPVAHFWFLWALFLNVALFTIFRIVVRPYLRRDTSFWLLAVCISALASNLLRLPEAVLPFFGNAVAYSIAFTTGGLIGSSAMRETVPSRWVAILSGILFSISLALSGDYFFNSPSVIAGSLASLLLLTSIVTFSAWFGKTRLAEMFSLLGAISLAIYVMHTVFSAAVRMSLSMFRVDDLAIHLVAGVAAGIVGPLAAYTFARRFGFLALLGLR